MRAVFVLSMILALLAGCADEAPRPEAPDATPVRIVFFGDSITEMGAAPGGYVALVADSLAALYPERSVEVVGAGISGHKVPDLQARLNRDVLSVDPTHVVIYIGINDVWHFHAFDDVTGTEQAVFEDGLRELVADLRADGAEVLLCTPSVIGEDLASDAPANRQLATYADVVRRVAAETDAPLCDLRAAFDEYLAAHNPEARHEGILTTDGVHLNAAGNRFVAARMVEHLRPLLAPGS